MSALQTQRKSWVYLVIQRANKTNPNYKHIKDHGFLSGDFCLLNVGLAIKEHLLLSEDSKKH